MACQPDEVTLRRLYEAERMTTRAIGAQFGVSKTEVLRWMIEYGIPRRAPGHGLAHRGLKPPTASELRHMIHVEHRSYADVGQQFGVDSTAVAVWLRKYGIRRPTVWETRRKGRRVPLPTADELRAMYESGLPAESIAERIGCSANPIYRLLDQYGIAKRPGGWKNGQRWQCADGHQVRSSYEQRVDDWLHAHGVPHEIEPRLPFGQNMRADFLVRGVYIEVWGVVNRASYRERKERKRRQYAEHGLPLLELSPHDFSTRSQEQYAHLLDMAFCGAPHRSSRLLARLPRTIAA